MNGTASTKARKESVGKPGSLVQSLQAGGVDRHQRDREDERRDDACRLPRMQQHGAARRDRADLPARSCTETSRRFGLGLLGRALERSARFREKHVVERRRPELEVGDVDAVRVDGADDSVSPRPSRSRTATSRVVASGSPNCARNSAMCGDPFSPRDRMHARPADLRLELRRRSLGDDLALVDDADPVGEEVRLLEVLRRQEHRDALLAPQPRDLLPERGPALRIEPVVGSSRKRIRGRGRARAPDRAAASCRPSRPPTQRSLASSRPTPEQLSIRAPRRSSGTPWGVAWSLTCRGR